MHAISMRATEKAVNFFSPFIPGSPKSPTWYSGRLWFLKLGHYKLQRPKQQASDWVWMVDHLVQAGHLKCLVVLGIRAKDLPQGKALTRADMEPLAIIPMETSNGTLVCKELKQLATKLGIPRAIVADHGSDIKLGIKMFCTHTKGTIYLYDIKHCMASLLKSQLQNDESWASFLELSAMTKKYLQQTKLAGLMPPNQRSKARYMNIEQMVSWGTKLLERLDQGDLPETVNQHKLKTKLGWLPFFRLELKVWDRIIKSAIHTETYIRTNGYAIGVTEKIQQDFSVMNSCPASHQFQQKIMQAVFKEETKLRLDERLPGSTEILESLFGSFKYFEGEQSQSGFTTSILALAAMVSSTTNQDIQQAAEQTKVNDLKEWSEQMVGQSVQAQRIEWLGRKPEQIIDERLAA